ncbi:hypothetical protein [Solicola sp. PLA-1-18]
MLARLRLARRLAHRHRVPFAVAWVRAGALGDPDAVRRRLDEQRRRR